MQRTSAKPWFFDILDDAGWEIQCYIDLARCEIRQDDYCAYPKDPCPAEEDVCPGVNIHVTRLDKIPDAIQRYADSLREACQREGREPWYWEEHVMYVADKLRAAQQDNINASVRGYRSRADG